MKLLESTRFEAINNALCITTGDSKIFGRIESYSCKMAGGDKAMYKRFNAEGNNPNDLQALSPPQGISPSYSRSVSGDEEGPLCDTISRKTLFYLIATLNSAFPDYDFLDVKVNRLSLFQGSESDWESFREFLWLYNCLITVSYCIYH